MVPYRKWRGKPDDASGRYTEHRAGILRTQVQNHGILLFSEVLLRMLYAGEFVTAISNSVHGLPEAGDDYVSPDDEYLALLGSFWDAGELSALAVSDIGVQMVKAACAELCDWTVEHVLVAAVVCESTNNRSHIVCEDVPL